MFNLNVGADEDLCTLCIKLVSPLHMSSSTIPKFLSEVHSADRETEIETGM